MGYYDAAASINEIIKITGVKKVAIAGHSQGSTVGFVLLATRPEFNEKVEYFAAMAPLVFMKCLGRPISDALKIAYALRKFRDVKFGLNSVVQRVFAKTFCGIANGGFCNGLINFILGPSQNQTNNVSLDYCFPLRKENFTRTNSIYFII